jgi:hypothetical protein
VSENLPVRKAPTKLTADRVERFLVEFAACGIAARAARVAGVTPSAVTHLKARDKDFAALYDDAKADFDAKLEEVALRFATQGIETPVFYQGVQTATKMQISERILELALKKFIPAYRESVKVDADVTTRFGVLVVPAQAVPREGESASEAWRRQANATKPNYTPVDAPCRTVDNSPSSPVKNPAKE